MTRWRRDLVGGVQTTAMRGEEEQGSEGFSGKHEDEPEFKATTSLFS
jgi:hypothetical protein